MKSTKSVTKTDQDIVLFWKKVLGILETELNPMAYKTWVEKISPENLTEDSIDLALPSEYAIKQIQKYSSLIQDAVDKVAKSKMKTSFTVSEVEKIELEAESLGPLFEPKKKQKVDAAAIRKSGLSPKFTFENYIIGNSNQLAFAIAQSISENPGETYNPFFLYSGVGLGKTHLVQAIGNKILQDNPKLNIVYTTGEAFMNELIETIQSGGRGKYTSNEFRKKYRQADVLIIDDIQFIIGGEATQKEFFHTFNELHMAGKQIILTSDRPPKDFVNLEKRITSRFGSGIIADIQHPDADLRTAILRTKRDISKDTMPNEVVDFIARKVDSNIRELEGAYKQVLAKASSGNTPPTVEIAQDLLGKNLNLKTNRSVNNTQILKAVCKYYEVKTNEIKGKRRTKELVIPRQVAMYLMRDMADSSLVSIGKFLGGRDHTTVMYGVEKIQDQMLEMGKIRQDIVNVKQML